VSLVPVGVVEGGGHTRGGLTVAVETDGFPPAVQGTVAVPSISPKSLVGHVVYGLFLGLIYPLVEDAL